MVDYVLQVPLVGQQVGYDGKPLMQQNAQGQTVYHGSMACWYASACMVSYYYRPGPRLGLPVVWRADKGLTVAAINSLAKAEGLKTFVKPAGGLTADTVATLLRTYGPIWAAGLYLNSDPRAGHAIVLTGVKGPLVLYNDPWEPKVKQREWYWIDRNLFNLSNALLVKDTMRS